MPRVNAYELFHHVGDPHTGVDVLLGVSLQARAGELTAVTGPSGAGKTSLLHLLAGLDRPDSGTVEIEGRSLGALDERELTRLRRDRVGLLLAAAAVLPTITVAENVALPLLIASRPPDRAAVDAMLARVGLGDRRGARPAQLTAAERQRAALARALMTGPSVLLCDEPAAELDAADRTALLELLRDVAHSDDVAVVLFTRDTDAAAAVADRVVALDGGRVVAAAEQAAA
jgi:putative ABC transport system ATP-binding protein